MAAVNATVSRWCLMSYEVVTAGAGRAAMSGVGAWTQFGFGSAVAHAGRRSPVRLANRRRRCSAAQGRRDSQSGQDADDTATQPSSLNAIG